MGSSAHCTGSLGTQAGEPEQAHFTWSCHWSIYYQPFTSLPYDLSAYFLLINYTPDFPDAAEVGGALTPTLQIKRFRGRLPPLRVGDRVSSPESEGPVPPFQDHQGYFKKKPHDHTP